MKSLLLVALLTGCAAPVAPIRELRLTPEDGIRPPTRGSTGKTYSTIDEAAVDACRWLWENVDDARRWELCGTIYRDAGGQIMAGLPETKSKPGHCAVPLPPPGVVLEGEYHNHLETEDFSKLDLQTKWAVAHYLCTPSGRVKKFTLGEGTVTLQ